MIWCVVATLPLNENGWLLDDNICVGVSPRNSELLIFYECLASATLGMNIGFLARDPHPVPYDPSLSSFLVLPTCACPPFRVTIPLPVSSAPDSLAGPPCAASACILI